MLKTMSSRYHSNKVSVSLMSQVLVRGDTDGLFYQEWNTIRKQIEKNYPSCSWNPFPLDCKVRNISCEFLTTFSSLTFANVVDLFCSFPLLTKHSSFTYYLFQQKQCSDTLQWDIVWCSIEISCQGLPSLVQAIWHGRRHISRKLWRTCQCYRPLQKVMEHIINYRPLWIALDSNPVLVLEHWQVDFYSDCEARNPRSSDHSDFVDWQLRSEVYPSTFNNPNPL